MKIKEVSIALMLAGIITAPTAFAASDAERIAQLEKQLKAMQEQIETLKKSRTASESKVRSTSASAKVNESKEVSALRDQMAESAKENVVVGDIPGSFRLPGSDSSVRIYGIAELNATHEFKGANSNTDYSTFAPYIPVRGSAQANRKGETYIHARTSRIGVEGSTPSAYGQINAKIEGDFNNDPRTGNSAVTGDLKNIYTQQSTNSYDFRLRHAYLQIGPNWLFGQTWSTFMDIDNTPETVDFNGPIGSTFIRQPMIRYTYTTPQYGNFTAAVENSVSYVGTKNGDGIFEATTAGSSRVPDLVVRWDKSFDWGSISLRAVTHEHRIKGGIDLDNNDATPDTDVNTSRRGYGLAASGQIKSVGDDYFSWIVTGGKGVGRYFNYIEGAGYDATNNSIVLEKALGVVLGYQHKYNDSIRLNFVYGMQWTFDNEYTDWARAQGLGTDSVYGQYALNKRVSQLHIGGFWAPTKPVEFGLEYIYGRRETLDGEKGDMSRINFLARYYLN